MVGDLINSKTATYCTGRGRPLNMTGPQLLANPPTFDLIDISSDFSTSDLTPSLGSNQAEFSNCINAVRRPVGLFSTKFLTKIYDF